MTPSADWEIPRRIWWILFSWGAAVLMLTLMLSVWIWTNQRQSARSQDQLRAKQDQVMCAMIEISVSGPEPAAGVEGDRQRRIKAAMDEYWVALRCDEIRPR